MYCNYMVNLSLVHRGSSEVMCFEVCHASEIGTDFYTGLSHTFLKRNLMIPPPAQQYSEANKPLEAKLYDTLQLQVCHRPM